MSHSEETLPADVAEEGGVALSIEPAPETSPSPSEEDSGLKTPAEWAEVCGHTDPKGVRLFDPVDVSKFRRWVFVATSVHEGWGSSKADDVQMSREAYEAAVNAAMGVSIGRSSPVSEAVASQSEA